MQRTDYSDSSSSSSSYRCAQRCAGSLFRIRIRIRIRMQGRRIPRRAGGQPRTWGQSVASWPEAPPPPLNFGLSENLLLVRNLSSKNANFEAEKLLFWGKFRVKIEILSTHGLLCRTFAAVCWNSVGNFLCLSENCKFLSRILLTNDAAEGYTEDQATEEFILFNSDGRSSVSQYSS